MNVTPLVCMASVREQNSLHYLFLCTEIKPGKNIYFVSDLCQQDPEFINKVPQWRFSNIIRKKSVELQLRIANTILYVGLCGGSTW